jgi:hypothetical protein
MTPVEIQGLIIVLGIAFIANTIMLGLALADLRAMRKDVIHAGMDIHQALVEANIYHRLAQTAPAAMPLRPVPAEAVAEESPEEWLARQRQKRGQKRG